MMTTSTKEALMAHMGGGAAATASASIASDGPRGDKVTVVGNGSLATAVLFALVAQKVSKEIIVCDKNLSNVRKEIQDIEDAALYMGSPNITCTDEWDRCRDSRVVILALGDQNDLDPNNNANLIREAILSMVQSCPGTVLLVASRPSDVLAWWAWRLASPHIPPHRVIGVGCSLETVRLRRAIAKRLHVAVESIQATVLGRGTPAWTNISACGVRLRDINPKLGVMDDPEDWVGTLEDVSNIPGVRAIAAAAARIADVIIRDSRDCLSVATHVCGCNNPSDPNKDVFMSLPCVLGHSGVAFIVRQALSQEEKDELQAAADTLSELNSKLEIT